MNLREIVLSSIFTGIVFVFTVIFTIATPATRGFFNVGEAGVYLSAIIGGPIVGAIAGGLGSALADIFLGYTWYAPGTFVIKALEGFIVGWLFRVITKVSRRDRVIMGVSVSIVMFVVLVYHGCKGITVELILPKVIYKLYLPMEIVVIISKVIYKLYLPMEIVVIIAVAISLCLIYTGIKGDISSLMAFACLLGGIEMVIGYFLYEALFLGYGLVAIVEVPVNIGQAVIGTGIAIPVIKTLEEMGVSASTETSKSEI